ncbi:hypothetical protein [Lichenicoccus sp.]|uniref:hypothetical protein n=1 Tax=Lichenicoccus sp. TaxID=2781899 RepID=UPI003D0FE678
MTRLSIGDHVSDLSGAHAGRLVDIDGATGYVMQENGVEVEFPLDRLKPYETPKVAETRTLSGPLRDRALSPAHKALLASVPPDLAAAIARSYEAGAEPSASRPTYAELPDSKKLEIIRIHLPALPQRVLAPHVRLVVAMRDLAKPGR